MKAYVVRARLRLRLAMLDDDRAGCAVPRRAVCSSPRVARWHGVHERGGAMTESSTKQLSNEDRMILAETFAARAEQHLNPQAQPDYAAAVEDARHLCEALGVDVCLKANAFT